MANTTKGKSTETEVASVNVETAVKVEIDRNTLLKVRNVTSSTLIYKSPKTHSKTKWNNHGDEELIEYGELITMKAGLDSFLTKPMCVIIEDSPEATEAINKLGLRKMYDDMLDIKDFGAFFRMKPNDAVEALQKAPQGTRQLIADKARELVNNDLLDSVSMIKALQKELQIDLIMVQKD